MIFTIMNSKYQTSSLEKVDNDSILPKQDFVLDLLTIDALFNEDYDNREFHIYKAKHQKVKQQKGRILAAQAQNQSQIIKSSNSAGQIQLNAQNQITPQAAQMQVQIQGQQSQSGASQQQSQTEAQIPTSSGGVEANQGQNQSQSGNGINLQAQGQIQVVFKPNGGVAVQTQIQPQISVGNTQQKQGQSQVTKT